MSIQEFPRPIVRAQRTFFNLLLSGYATGVAPEHITRFEGDSGTKRNVWKDDEGWLGIDEWRTTDLGDGSNGTTSIYYNKVLVWEMQYGGFYPKRVIPFLRRALLQNYSKGIWLGGRGPKVYQEGNFVYYNEVAEGSDFARFSGTECIYESVDRLATIIGTHHYRHGFLY